MSNDHSIEKYIEQFGEEIEVNAQGIGKASVRGTARLAGVSHPALTKAFEPGNLGNSKLSVFLTEWGIEPGNQALFSSEGIGDIACSLIVKYYATYAGRYCNKQAQKMDMAMSAGGVRSWMQKLKGWKPEHQHQLPQTYLEALKALVASEEEKARLQQQKQKLQDENERLAIMNEDLEQEVEILAEEVDELFSHSSIIRIAKYNQVDEKQFKWRLLKAEAKKLGLEVKKVPCPRYQTKNLYPHQVWQNVYPDAALPESTTITVRLDEKAS